MYSEKPKEIEKKISYQEKLNYESDAIVGDLKKKERESSNARYRERSRKKAE